MVQLNFFLCFLNILESTFWNTKLCFEEYFLEYPEKELYTKYFLEHSFIFEHSKKYFLKNKIVFRKVLSEMFKKCVSENTFWNVKNKTTGMLNTKQCFRKHILKLIMISYQCYRYKMNI